MIINLNNVVNKVIGAAKILVGNVSGDATAVDMSGEATIDNAGAVTLDNDSVIAKVLTGYSAAGYTPITATDSIITAIESLESLATSINDDYLTKGLSTGKVYIGTANEAVERDISGDATISNSGVLTVNKRITTNRQTASYQLALTDEGKLVEMNVASANNLTVPPNSTIAFPTGTQILLSQYGAGTTTVVAGSGVTIRSADSMLDLRAQYSGATLVKIATNEWYLFGDLA